MFRVRRLPPSPDPGKVKGPRVKGSRVNGSPCLVDLSIVLEMKTNKETALVQFFAAARRECEKVHRVISFGNETSNCKIK